MPKPENVLHEILPTHVHQYFLFDGEQLDEFFEEGYSDRVRDAVHDVSHVELLENAVNHLDSVRREFEKESSGLGGNVSELQKRKENAEQELDRLKKERDDLRSDIEEANGKIEGINDQLAGSQDEDVRDKQERRQWLEAKLEEKESQLTKSKARVGTGLAQAGAVALNADAMAYAVDALEEHETDQTEITGLNEELLDAIITRKECICGKNFSDTEDAREHFRELHDELRSNDHSAIEGRLRIKRALEEGDELIETLIQDDLGELQEIRDWIDEKDDELSRIESQLEDVDTIDNEKAAELEQQRQRLRSRVEDMNQELGELEGKIKSQNQTIDERREEWKKAMQKEEENQILIEKSVFIEDSAEKLDEIKSDILQQVRSETEERLERYYNDLIWKDDDYNISLTERYEVQLYDQDGKKNLGSLAAGERQVLALAFMAALSKISGFSAPIVIDTPLGRISSDPKKLIAQNVPNYLKDTQVTFLMTDVEYSDDVRAFVQNAVANEYRLDYQHGVTEVMNR